MSNRKAIVEVRSQHSRGSASGFGGPDTYVAVHRTIIRRSEICDDLDAYYAPSECYGLAMGSLEKDLTAGVVAMGWEVEEYNQALKDRVSARVARDLSV